MNAVHSMLVVAASASATCATAASAQPSNVLPSHKHAWTENCGWLNWRDAGSPAAAQGARSNGLFLAGFVWGENIGYINLGDGTPANGLAYGNILGSDFGVNILPDARLGGRAWGENVGWINFGPHATLAAAQQARFDFATGRLLGYAWGENIGWVNLDHGTHYVAFRACAADLSGSSDPNSAAYGVPDTFVDASDFFYFLDQFAADNFAVADLTSSADPNSPGYGVPDGTIDASDFFFYLDLFVQGCT